MIFAVLLLGTLLRYGQVYFRCREERAAYCEPTEFHKPIRLMLSFTGNLNGHSLPVSVASYGPAVLGSTLVAFWASLLLANAYVFPAGGIPLGGIECWAKFY